MSAIKSQLSDDRALVVSMRRYAQHQALSSKTVLGDRAHNSRPLSTREKVKLLYQFCRPAEY